MHTFKQAAIAMLDGLVERGKMENDAPSYNVAVKYKNGERLPYFVIRKNKV